MNSLAQRPLLRIVKTTGETPFIQPVTDEASLQQVLENIQTVKENQEYLLQLLSKQPIQNYFTPVNYNFSSYILPQNLIYPNETYLANPNQLISLPDRNTTNGVPVYLIMELGALATATICLAALVSWMTLAMPFISPFMALLGLAASPFFFAMGRISRRELTR